VCEDACVQTPIFFDPVCADKEKDFTSPCAARCHGHLLYDFGSCADLLLAAASTAHPTTVGSDSTRSTANKSDTDVAVNTALEINSRRLPDAVEAGVIASGICGALLLLAVMVGAHRYYRGGQRGYYEVNEDALPPDVHVDADLLLDLNFESFVDATYAPGSLSHPRAAGVNVATATTITTTGQAAAHSRASHSSFTRPQGRGLQAPSRGLQVSVKTAPVTML